MPSDYRPSVQQTARQLRAADQRLADVETAFLNAAKPTGNYDTPKSDQAFGSLKLQATSAISNWTAVSKSGQQEQAAFTVQATEYLDNVVTRHRATKEILKGAVASQQKQIIAAKNVIKQVNSVVKAGNQNANYADSTDAQEVQEFVQKAEYAQQELPQLEQHFSALTTELQKFQGDTETRILLDQADTLQSIPMLSGARVGQALTIGSRLNDLVDSATRRLDEQIGTSNISQLLADLPRIPKPPTTYARRKTDTQTCCPQPGQPGSA